MAKIGIILGSTRPGRRGEQVAEWVQETAARREDAEFELIDLLEHRLPYLNEPQPAVMARGRYEHEHTKAWASVIAAFDGFVIVTPEYNAGIPGELKSAIDYLYWEWHDKAVGFVSYGSAGGARSVGQLRQVAGALGMADVARDVVLPLMTEFEGFTTFKPGAHSVAALDTMLDQVVAWSGALAPLRGAASALSAS